MTAEEHAKVWRKATRILLGMSNYDPGRIYSEKESIALSAYATAATVLSKIADSYEAAAKPAKVNP